MPGFDQFPEASQYYSVLAHETTHFTSHASRCDRQLGKRFGDAAYAMEELIAELGSAFGFGGNRGFWVHAATSDTSRVWTMRPDRSLSQSAAFCACDAAVKIARLSDLRTLSNHQQQIM